MVPVGVIYEYISGKREFSENRLSENDILLRDVNELLPVPVLSRFLDLRALRNSIWGITT